MKKTKAGRRKRKLEFENIAGFLGFEKRAYFSDYLENEIGASWYKIKCSLYDAGYTTTEVNEYRERLLSDFRELCRVHGFAEYI